jgi:hypothetical protein
VPTQTEVIIEAFHALQGVRSVAEIREWVNKKSGNKWRDFATAMADMVPVYYGGNNSSHVSNQLRVLMKVDKGKYCLISKGIAHNEHLAKFQWNVTVVNHTVHQTNWNLNYPTYNANYNEGIYIFINQNGQILYVGQSGDLTNRLRFRFKELHGRGDKDYQYHDEFFQNYQDENMIILTTEITGGKKRRELVEEYLTCYLQPEFIRFKFNKFFNSKWIR